MTHSTTSIDTAGRIQRSAMKLLRIMNSFKSENSLSMTKLGVLTHLYREGVTTATTLAAFLGIKPQSVTRLISDLEKDQLITRKPDNIDRRQNLIQITPTGVQVLLKEGSRQQGKLAQVIDTFLTTSEEDMLRLSAGIMDHLTASAQAHFQDP